MCQLGRQCGPKDDHRNMALSLEEVVAEQGSGVGSRYCKIIAT